MLSAGIARITWIALGVLLISQLTACSVPRGNWEDAGSSLPDTTFGKFLERADAGDAESQNVVGFMLFHGEGVRRDRTRAQVWFQRAATQGNIRARRNLAILQSAGETGSGPPSKTGSSATSVQAPSPGQALYGKYCAGCHGFNGISSYVHSPSFALGEALDKSDGELMRSLMRGKGEMPNWDNKFSPDQLQHVLRFVRTLRARYELGIGQSLSGAPPVFYLFGPMSREHSAYRGLSAD